MRLLILGAAALSPSCSPAEGGTDPEGSGGNVAPEPEPEPLACGAHLDVAVEIGEGVGSAFRKFEEGDHLRLEFASQAGLEAAVSVRTYGADPYALDDIELSLVVDGAPIGESSTSPNGLRCEGDEFGRVDTSLPIDVTAHPTVASVAQLDETPAQLHVALLSSEGLVVEHTVEMILQP